MPSSPFFRGCSVPALRSVALSLGLLLTLLIFRSPASAGMTTAFLFQQQVAQDTTRPASTGQMTRRARAEQSRRTTQVTSTPTADTSKSVLELIRALPRDSSARLQHFQYVRTDRPAVDPLASKPHPLYLPDPLIVKYRDQLDSTRWVYRLRQVIGENDLRFAVEIPFEEYTELRLRKNVRGYWENIAQAYVLQGEKKTGLSELFGKVTNIEIPVPKNPLFSIFGPNRILLNINGAVDIHAAFRNTKSDLYSASPLGQSRSEPDFNQEVLVNVKGEIGDKLKIDADWNTQRTFEYENQLKVRYQGYEDEIVQTVEAGNVSLATSSSFISSSQALFGLKAGFQFGPLKLTAVATQKKGQIKELSVSGGARSTPFEKRAADYSRDHYFVDTSYISLYEDIYYRIPAIPVPAKQIRDMEVWVSRVGISLDLTKEREVVAIMDDALVVQLAQDSLARLQDYGQEPDSVETGTFVRLDAGTDYTYNADAGILTMNKSIQPDQAIAVAYITTDDFGRTIEHGNFGARTVRDSLKLVMKLVRPKNLDPTKPVGWRMLLKNRYPLGGRGIKESGFELRMEYEVYGQPPVQDILTNIGLLELFGLDRFTGVSTPKPDKSFDYLKGVTIDEGRGEVVFPTVEPFRDATLRRMFISLGIDPAQATAYADSFSFNAIYDTTYNGAVNDRKNKYYFRGNTQPSTASSYNLGFNIVEGSVEVIVDGVRATPNVDYSVDYVTGQVVIKNQALLVPGKNLQVKYEANDLFQLASKSLLGARGDLSLSKSSRLGFTIMNLNQQSLSDKVRLGEEPISNTIMGVDGETQLALPFVTKALNYLPGVKTLAPSSMTLRGEMAYMSPDPNTRKSPVPSDNGASVAYIDDFEGARVSTPLGVAFTQWRDASPPFFIKGLDPYAALTDSIPTSSALIASGDILADTLKIQYKGRATWFNVTPSDVLVEEIWGDRKSVARGQEQITVMSMLFQPGMRGAFNYSLDLENRLFADPTKSWGGIQHLLGITSTNLIDQNVTFIEFWVNVVESQSSAKLNVDLGYLSEDIIPNGRLNSEDGLDGSIKNGVLNEGEDLGIDMLSDAQEREQYRAFVTKYAEYEADPSGDNWRRPTYGIIPGLDAVLAEQYFASPAGSPNQTVNGSEGNSKGEYGIYPDAEDFNNNNVLDRTNAYFEYEIPLDTNAPDFQRLVSGRGERGWYQLRIPLNEYQRMIGQPTFTNVEGVRVWVTGASANLLFRIAEFNLVGNQWEERLKNDPNFKVSVVNYEDDPNYRLTNPPVERQKDRTRPDENVYGNEQSLNLIIRDLGDGQNKEAIKRYNFRPLDMFSYRALRIFIHGEEGDSPRGYRAFGFRDTSDYDAEVFLRFGSDSLNYYEYRAPVKPGWEGNEIVVKFADLTAIKLVRDSARVLSRRFPVTDGPVGATYQVLGEPTLTNIRFISLGVENPLGKGATTLDGELWANELRLTEVDDTPGWAYRFDTQVRMADLASFVFSFSERDPFFHALEERFGSRTTTRNWTLSANIGLEKLLPETWNGTNLNVTYTHTEGSNKPRYMPSTDILVDEAAQRVEEDTSSTKRDVDGQSLRTRTQDLNVTDTYALPGLRLNIPVNTWWVTETINRMTFGYSYNITRRRSPVTEYAESWGWNAQFNYALPLSANNYLQPFSFFPDAFPLSLWRNARVFYTPRQVSMGFTLSRNQSRDKSRIQAAQNPVVRNLAATRSFNFNWQLTEGGLINPGIDYQVSIASSLVHLEVDKFGNQRSFADILDDMILSDRLISFGIDQNYGQTISLNTRMVIPPVLKLDKIFTLNPSPRYTVRYDWSNNIQAGALGRSAGWNANINAGFDVNVKTIADAIWPPDARGAQAVPDSMKPGPLAQLASLSQTLFKTTLFGFERFNLSFTQQNRSQNSGVVGGTGFGNLFARFPFLQSSLVANGPSLLYQLGLSTSPHGDVILRGSSGFPFMEGYSVAGIRAPRGNLNDIFSQNNSITMRTNRKLWEGADLDLNWRVSWTYNQSRVILTDSLGQSFERSRTISGDVERSFMSFPPVLIFKLFKTSVADVNKKYEELKQVKDGRPAEQKLTEAFEQGLEALPILTKLIGPLMPRANWTIRWTGIEKLPLLNSIASRASLDHSYTSSYRQRWRSSPTGGLTTESQTVSVGFAPLIGLNVAFKDFIKGNLSATIRYGSNTSYDLAPSAQNLVESATSDISFTANYNRQGFEIPLFGLALSNDLDANVTYTIAKNARRVYDFRDNFKPEGQPMEGSSRTVLEPRIRYVLSARVTSSLYYRYTKISPDAGGSRIPGSTINEGGLDIHVAIQ